MFITIYNTTTLETITTLEVGGDFLLTFAATPGADVRHYLRVVGHNGITPGLDRVSVSAHDPERAVDIFNNEGEVMGSLYPRAITGG